MSQKRTLGKCMFRKIFHADWYDLKILLHSFCLLQEQTLPPRPEAYPIPTQTYTREYFTFPASKSQDRMAPAQSQWPNYEEKAQVQAESNNSINTTMQVRSNFFQFNKKKAKKLLAFHSRLLETFLQNSQLFLISEVLRTNYTTEGKQLYYCQDWLGFRNPFFFFSSP